MAEGTGNRQVVQQWVQSVEKARPETPEDSDRGLNSNLDYLTYQMLSSQTAQASHMPQRRKPHTLPRIIVKESATQIPLWESTRTHFKEEQPLASGKREKSQSPLPDPTPSQDLPPFDLPRTSQKHPKPLLRALTYGGFSKPCGCALAPEFRSSTSPDLLSQSNLALLFPDHLSSCSQDIIVAGEGGAQTQSGLRQCRSSSDTNLARVGVTVSPALSPEGSHSGSSSNSVHSGELLSSNLGSPYYNVSPVHSGDEINGGPRGNIATTTTATSTSKNNWLNVVLLPRSDTSGRREEGSSGEEDSSSGGGEKSGGENLPPLQQEELRLLSIHVGEHLPQLVLLLGMEECDYENIATTVGSSKETQALQLLMRWFEHRRGGRSELAEALRRVGIERIAQLLLQDRLELLCKEQDRSPMTGTKPTSTLSPSHSHQTKGLSRQQLQLHAKQSFTFDEDDEDWMVAPDKRIKKHHKFLANRSASITISSPPLSHISQHSPLEHTRSHGSTTTHHTASPLFSLSRLSLADRRGSAPNSIKSEKLQTFHPPMDSSLKTSETSSPSIFPQFPRPTSLQPLSKTGITHNLTTSVPSQLQRTTVGSTFLVSEQRLWYSQQQEHFKKPGPSRQDSGISTLSSISRSDMQY